MNQRVPNKNADLLKKISLMGREVTVGIALKCMEFVTCWYNFYWNIGLILKLDENQLEADIKFMCPVGQSPSFYWPEQHDICTLAYN